MSFVYRPNCIPRSVLQYHEFADGVGVVGVNTEAPLVVHLEGGVDV